MWNWLTGKNAEEAKEHAHTHTAAAANPHSPSSSSAAAASSSSPSTAVVPHGGAAGSSSSSVSAPPHVPGAGPPPGVSFWGFTETSGLSADRDPALDDMMEYFGFAHHRASEYSGAVCFRLKYDDGTMAIRTVEVLPLQMTQGEQQRLRDVADNTHRMELQETNRKALMAARPTARVRIYPRLQAPDVIAAATTPSPSSALVPVPPSQGHTSWLLPPACATLTIATRTTPVSDALVPAAAVPSDAVVSGSGQPLPSMPCSPRVRVYRGEVPSHVKLSATLSCPRDVFFDVYMGRLDPIKSVLTGKAHCSGYKYMRLLHFGQAFDLHSQKWVEFYKAQGVVTAATGAQQKALNSGTGNGSGSVSLAPSSGTAQLRLVSSDDWLNGGDDRPTARALRSEDAAAASSSSSDVDSQVAFAMAASSFGLPAAAAFSLYERARARAAAALPVWTAAAVASLTPAQRIESDVRAVARRAAFSAVHRVRVMPGATAAAPLPSVPRTFTQIARQVHAATHIVIACDEFD